jgi:hypothetical protein
MATIDMPAEPSLPENKVPAPLAIPSAGGRRRFSLADMLRFVLPAPASKAEAGELGAERRERERLKQHEVTLQAEASLYAQLIPEKLADLKICYFYRKSEKDFGERIKKVEIRKPYVLRDEAIYLHVDLRPGKSPRGVGVEELSDPRTLSNLAVACGHKVLCRYTPEKGFWYVVEREHGVRGIPAHVQYDAILSARPASADGLALPIGMGENKRAIWKSLAQMQGMLIAGTTGGGKSNDLNVIICTLLRYNSKRRLRLLLVDLKGGVEFSYYAGIPHLLPIPLPAKKKGDPDRLAAIIEDRQDVVPAFEWLVEEGERRLAMLKADHSKHIGEYNYHHRNDPMPHICFVVDEWADVKLEPKLGKEAEELLINIASRFRAVGIHPIVCTQTPNKDVVSIRVKNVLPARLAFACPSIHSSMLIIGNGRAAGLEPAGRAIFDWGQTQLEIQTPLINNATVDETVASAIRGQFDDVEVAAHDVTDQEIYVWAVNENNGELQSREVYGKFRLRGMSKAYAEKFAKDADGQTVIVGATAYKVVPGNRRQPRRLLPVADDPETPPTAPAAP